MLFEIRNIAGDNPKRSWISSSSVLAGLLAAPRAVPEVDIKLEIFNEYPGLAPMNRLISQQAIALSGQSNRIKVAFGTR